MKRRRRSFFALEQARDAMGRPYPLPASGEHHPLRRLVAILRPYRWLLALAVVLGVLHQGLGIFSAGLSAHLVGLAAVGNNRILGGLVLLAVAVLAVAVLAWIKMWFEYELAHRILAELRIWLYAALERLAPASLAGKRIAELASTAMTDIARVDWFFARLLPGLLTALLVPAAALAFLFVLEMPLALGLLPFAVLMVWVPIFFRRRAQEQGAELRAAHARVNAEVLDGVQGMSEILAFGREGDWLRRIDRRSRELKGRQIAYGVRQGTEAALVGALTAAGMFTVLALAAHSVSTGSLPPERLPVAVLVASAFFAPILATTGALARLGLVSTSAERVFELLEQRPRVEDRPPARQAQVPSELRPRIAFENVWFGYGGPRQDVLRGVSFAVEPGETVALVGASGAGKSTCIQLLLRFWDVDQGRITLAGQDLRQLPSDWLRRQIAWVPQEPFLFDQTVIENLRLGKAAASLEEVTAAARAAQAEEFILSLPEGYETRVGERGVQLSGGQRQRIMIARALLKEAPILVLDEAVSNLDSENEQAFQRAMNGVRRSRTVLVVAHRLSTIRSADRIVVLDDGKVLESGSHDRLVATGGAYARLIASQQSSGGES